jgi:hypothetical protein
LFVEFFAPIVSFAFHKLSLEAVESVRTLKEYHFEKTNGINNNRTNPNKEQSKKVHLMCI